MGEWEGRRGRRGTGKRMEGRMCVFVGVSSVWDVAMKIGRLTRLEMARGRGRVMTTREAERVGWMGWDGVYENVSNR